MINGETKDEGREKREEEGKGGREMATPLVA